jgi:DNA ligase 1
MTTPLSEIVRVSEQVGATSGRLEKIARLRELLRALAPAEIVAGVHYLSGQLLQGRIGVGGALLAAVRPAPSAGQATLTVAELDHAITALAAITGPGSGAVRKRLLGEVFGRATAAEQDFLHRLFSGELRQGALEGVMVEALAQAAALKPSDMRRALMVAGDIGVVAHAALTEGERGLARFSLQVLQPVRPMLAQPAAGVAEALAQLGQAVFEYKIDGARVQVHRAGTEVRVYTRHLKDVTASVPELVEAAQRLAVSSVILEGEAIAMDNSGRPHPFQVTMRRFGRRLDIERQRASLPLSTFFFDCLHRDGVDLIGRPLHERFIALADIVPEQERIRRCVTTDAAAAHAFLDDALAAGHEGVMAKALDAPYEAGQRASRWLKIKPAHTLDLVVLAAEWGHGRRRGWLSNLHLGARDPASGTYVMLGKTFKGMTDQILAWQTERLQQLKLHEDAYTVYVRPALVVEIAFNDIQDSPHYPGGLALRFARVKRYRDDKTPEEADTIGTVRLLKGRQSAAEN